MRARVRVREPWFGADAADLLAMDGAVSADVTASIANDAVMLPAGSAIVVDDFQYAADSAARDMTALIERWPAETVQLVLSARVDPPLRLHRLRLAGELCELRDRELYFSLAESEELLANFGVQLAAANVALLHERTEGWAAALQMAALSLRGTGDPGRAARALDVRSYAIAEYFSDEVLEQQPAEVTRFLLDTCVLGELTADACAAVTGRQDAGALLHSIDAANLFVVALDEERTSFRGQAGTGTRGEGGGLAGGRVPGPGRRCGRGGRGSGREAGIRPAYFRRALPACAGRPGPRAPRP